jgi:hypothetical protein
MIEGTNVKKITKADGSTTPVSKVVKVSAVSICILLLFVLVLNIRVCGSQVLSLYPAASAAQRFVNDHA